MSNKKNILVTGANGQLGMEFRSIAGEFPGYEFLFATKESLPIDDPESAANFFSENRIDYCINCAAYTAVDKAESEKEIANEINGYAAGRLAALCKKSGVAFIHFSTDYVFNGNASTPYKESDQTDPVNAYGASKLLGEKEALKQNPDALIIRTSWVYSSFGKNFVKTMLRLMNEKEQLSVVNDQVGCPTYANDLARAVMEIIEKGKTGRGGIYAFCNEGVISWYEFAQAIKEISGSSCKVEPVPSSAYPTPAKRPRYSVLDTSSFSELSGKKMSSWKDSLEKCLKLLLR